MSSVRRKTIEHEIFGGPLCVILLALDNSVSERAERKIFVKNIQNRAISSLSRDFTGVPVVLCSFFYSENCWLCLTPAVFTVICFLTRIV